MTASAGYAWPARWSVRAAIGMLLDGDLEGAGRTHDIGPGVVAAASVAKQWAFGDWFVIGTFGVGASRTETVEDRPGAAHQSLIATDLFRLGGTAGRTFGMLSPYLLARGFGGPVFWSLDDEDVRGSDIHHFQLGGGASLTTASGLSILVDVAALGERSVSLGMAFRI